MEKKKGKEKAYNIIDGGGGDSNSDNEDLHHVKFEKCATTTWSISPLIFCTMTILFIS
jgi:hypothetical protein